MEPPEPKFTSLGGDVQKGPLYEAATFCPLLVTPLRNICCQSSSISVTEPQTDKTNSKRSSPRIQTNKLLPLWGGMCPSASQLATLMHKHVSRLNAVTWINQRTLELSDIYVTRMWANAQRDGHSAEHRWRTLFNAAKFGWRPLLGCRAVTLRRRESRWNLEGCPKLVNRSQPLVGGSSPYCVDMWRRYCCLTSFFRLSIYASVAKI